MTADRKVTVGLAALNGSRVCNSGRRVKKGVETLVGMPGIEIPSQEDSSGKLRDAYGGGRNTGPPPCHASGRRTLIEPGVGSDLCGLTALSRQFGKKRSHRLP